MCGIVGFVDLAAPDRRGVLRAMQDAIAHRGPDGRGDYLDGRAGLAMTRLSIIDLAGGDQPKTAREGDIQIVFNGEIYNYRGLQAELTRRGHVFESASDSEVVARAFAEWGADAFTHLHGMFAIAAWEVGAGRLTLARDRIGKKPLYVWRRGTELAFASELKAFFPLGRSLEVDRQAFTEYLHLGYVPDPHSIWLEVEKLPPGHVGQFEHGNWLTRPYWHLNVEPAGVAVESSDPVDELHGRLSNAVADRLVADVEVGVLLSGGVDSSLVTWLAAEQHPRIRTFSVAFDDPALDESAHARAVASDVGTDHNETLVTASEALKVVEELPTVYDEPFADSSSVPTLLVSRFAAEHVKVVLGGDGGDELFNGYHHYWAFDRITRLRRAVPGPLRRLGRPLARSRGSFLSRGGNVLDLMDDDPATTYRNVVSILAPGLLTAAVSDPVTLDELAASFRSAWGLGPERVPRTADLAHYLPGDILVKVDRASMSAGLEVRAPFLDTALVEWAFRLSPATIGPPGAKAIPRALLARRFPPSV
ncbi:MAG: asparagine synthase (glutamine-hydrolyzing), partial [Acidimicrobiales bacterium]|nr:asparagine synthase (glutamine-hydrolyzing) [Acidimicrobiales bacterium]